MNWWLASKCAYSCPVPPAVLQPQKTLQHLEDVKVQMCLGILHLRPRTFLASRATKKCTFHLSSAPEGSIRDGMWAEDKERWMMSFSALCQGWLFSLCLQRRPWVIRGMPNGSGNRLYIPQGSTRRVACSALVKSRVTSNDLRLCCLTAVQDPLQRFPQSEGPEGPPLPCHQACHCPDKKTRAQKRASLLADR